MNKTIKYYSNNANHFISRFETEDLKSMKRDWHKFVPKISAIILEVGAGAGRDSAWFSEKGHEVLAVEPADELREKAAEIYKDYKSIDFVNDSLPELNQVTKRLVKYDFILLSAVWMHLKEGKEREIAFKTLSNLLKQGAKVAITLRFGKSPDEREMFPVSAKEIYTLAKKNGLSVVGDSKSEDVYKRDKVSWQTIVCSNS